ncbi:MAG: NAD-dependent epimerase/dehydratase family protein [Ilumatobacteraceae bacterium]|nr:NAD-dependent epimerase/dehydratase family protein [Ilumatobacteraceae bacterium]
MRVLVTGGAGFIGSHIVEQLVHMQHDVVVVDDLDPAAHCGEPLGLSPAAQYLWCDVRDPETWVGLLDGIDAVCHQAAKVGLGVDFGDVTEYVSRNGDGTACMLRAMHDSAFTGRLVLASSMVVYGEGRYRCQQHGVVRPEPRRAADLAAGRFDPLCPGCDGALVGEAVPEDHWLDPRNVYAVTKLAQEGLCRAYEREHPGCVATLLRYHNVYGPRMPRDTPYAGVASLFRSAYERGEAPMVFEDGGQIRDFVHVSDVARANVLALTNDMAVSGPLNVCSGDPRTILDLAEAIRPSGDPVPQVIGSFRLGDIRHVFASPARARQLLGFRAEVQFSDGVRAFSTAPLRSARDARSPGSPHA